MVGSSGREGNDKKGTQKHTHPFKATLKNPVIGTEMTPRPAIGLVDIFLSLCTCAVKGRLHTDNMVVVVHRRQ